MGTIFLISQQASQHADGYLAAAVSYPPVEGDADGNDTGRDAEDLEAMLKDLNDWQERVGDRSGARTKQRASLLGTRFATTSSWPCY